MQDMLQNKTQVETVNFHFILKSSSDRMKYNTLQLNNVERKGLTCVRKLGRSKQSD